MVFKANRCYVKRRRASVNAVGAIGRGRLVNSHSRPSEALVNVDFSASVRAGHTTLISVPDRSSGTATADQLRGTARLRDWRPLDLPGPDMTRGPVDHWISLPPPPVMRPYQRPGGHSMALRRRTHRQ